MERSARLVHFDQDAPVFSRRLFSRASPTRPPASQYNSIVGASISLRGAGAISCDTRSCGAADARDQTNDESHLQGLRKEATEDRSGISKPTQGVTWWSRRVSVPPL